MALNNSIIGQQLLDYGTVKIASNKPENVFLLMLETEEENVNITIIYDRRFDVLMGSRDYRVIGEEHSHDDRNIEFTPEQKAQVISFIESYEE